MRFPEVLCYPSPDPECVLDRVIELTQCGIKEVINEGNLLLKGWRLLGRGHSAVILKAKLANEEKVAVKVLRSDSRREDLLLECSFLMKGYPITPKIYCCRKHSIVMELIDGFSLEELFQGEELTCQEALLMVLKVFEAAYWLDRLGIDHKELSRPGRHIFLTREGRVKIIDFESASGGPAKNLLRVFSWFIMRSWFGERCCRRKRGIIDEVSPLLRLYVKEPEKVFRQVVKNVLRECSSTEDIYS